MSNVLYASARAGYLDGSMCWTKGVHCAQLWQTVPYAPLHTTVQNLIDAGGVLVASSDPMVTSVTAAGAADATDAYFASVATGPVITVITIAQTSGPTGGAELPAAQQRLVAFINRGANLPFTPSGRPVVVRWSDLVTRIFS